MDARNTVPEVPPLRIPDHVPACLGGLDELRGEVLDPSVDAHVVDLDAAFSEELLDVPVGQAEP